MVDPHLAQRRAPAPLYAPLECSTVLSSRLKRTSQLNTAISSHGERSAAKDTAARTEIDDAQFSLPSLKGHRKDKSGHRKSRDGSATHRSRDDQLHHRRNSRSEDIKPEDTVNVDSLNQSGNKKLSSDSGVTGAVAALSPVEKVSKKKKKKRKKRQKSAESEHLSEMSNPADAKNGPKVIDKPTQEVSSPKDAVAVVKPSDAAAVRETQVDTSLQTDKAHQAVLTEAVSKERGVPQAGNDVSSDDREHPFEDLSKAAAVKSKLKRTIPATGGPFGGLSSTRSSSLDRSVERRYSNAVSMAVEKKTLSLLPEQASSTIANEGEAHVDQPGQQDTLSPMTQVSEVKISMPDHAGGLCTTISETEKEHSDMSGIHQPSGKHAGDEYSPAAPKRSSPILHYEPDTGRRVSVTIPKWGGPFGGSTADEVSESLHDQEATRKAEAKSSPPQKSPLYMAPFTPDEVKKEETTLPPDHGVLSPPTIQKKVARHVLEESVFTELSGDSEECLDEQQRKASQSSVSSAESSAFKSSQGSFVQSPHSKVDNDVNAPRRMRSMSLVLLEDAPSLLSKPINTASSPASAPPDVVVSLPKLEGADFCQQLPILPTTADQTEKSDKEAKSEETKKAGTREMTSSVTPPIEGWA
ncbi:hypothetical protein MRX96_012532 [Rhipicephalus microplus]